MSTEESKSEAMRFVEDLTGGSLTLGGLLAAIRLGDGITQVEFARQLGVSRSHLCDIEKSRKSVSPKRATAFARTLGYGEAQFVRLALQDMVRAAGLEHTVQVATA